MEYYSKDVARETGMSTEGLRYYEKKGIIRFHKNSENGYRTYPIMQVPLLRMIKILNSYGIPLAEVSRLLHQGDDELIQLKSTMETAQAEKNRIRTREAVAPLLRAAKEKDLHITGDIYFMSVAATEPEPTETRLYYQIMAPVVGSG
ncbi:MAG: MerR family transcriptional regulator [Lachnospiraceae bacterium]|nr:MerR family transcriptional regulator [Lachnospiraceae bacterium]